jgi:hypothetical protein
MATITKIVTTSFMSTISSGLRRLGTSTVHLTCCAGDTSS